MVSDSGLRDSDASMGSLSTGAINPERTGRERIVRWFERWRKPLHNWIAGKSCVPVAEADDLTQEVFLRLLRYSNEILVENPQGYLFRIASNVLCEWRERCRVRMPHDDIGLEELIDPANEPGSEWEQASVSRYLWAAVDQLPQRQRDILLLHVTEGMTYKQIAKARGLTYRIVLRDLCRAYVTLRGRLRPNEI